jgi:hypothetical protein
VGLVGCCCGVLSARNCRLVSGISANRVARFLKQKREHDKRKATSREHEQRAREEGAQTVEELGCD